MKALVKILPLLVALAMSSAAIAAPSVALKTDTISVTVTPTHYKDLLVLKASKHFIGATVQIHDATGIVVATSYIHKKKMIIDFYDIPYGTYTIRVLKNNESQDFTHTKNHDSEIFN